METDLNDPQITEKDATDFDSAFEKALGPDAEIVLEGNPTPEKAAAEPEAPKEPAAPTPKETPASPAVTPKEAPKTPPAQVPAPTATSDAEIEGIAPPKNISPRNLEGWHALRAKALERGEEIKTLRAEVQSLQGKVGQVDPSIQQRLQAAEEEANRLRLLYTNERDPEFVAKYDTPIQTNETTVLGILEKGGMHADNLAKIKEIGINAVPDAFWREHVLPNVSIVEAKQIEQALADNARLKNDRVKALDDVKTNFKKYEEDQRTKNVQSFDVYRNEMGQTLTKLTEGLPWCKKQEIPANATPEQREIIEKQNAFYEQSEQRFQFALFPPSASARVEVAFAACLSYKLADDLAAETGRAEAAEQKATQLQAKLDAIKTAGITNQAGRGTAPESKNRPVDRLDMSNDAAIEAGLQELGV